MIEQFARVGAHELCYVDEGPRDGPPLLLIMGLGLQLTAWPQALVDLWTAAGFRVIRYDHRDIGRSTPLDQLPTPSFGGNLLRYGLGLRVQAPYSLADLADDAAGLLQHLSIARAQVLGVSMGGMVAQHLAHRHPQQLSALHLWMTSPGGRWLPPPAPRVGRLMLQRPRNREQALAHYLALFQALAGPGYPSPEAELRDKVQRSAARAWRPQATLRQLLAIAADGDRARWLRTLDGRLPIRIAHGLADPLLPPAHGRRLARLLPSAQAHWVAGWGHDLPSALLPQLAAQVPLEPGKAACP